MKRTPQLGLLLVSILLLGGCDGYSRALYLREPNGPKPPWHVGATTVKVCGGQNIVAIVRSTAKELQLAPDPNLKDAWVDNPEGWRFAMSVRQLADGLWVASLADWPSVKRSDLSIAAEKSISGKLKMPSTHIESDGLPFRCATD